jgi:hypothetical protein
MSIDCRVGLWHDGLGIQFTASNHVSVVRYIGSVTLSAGITPGRRLIVGPGLHRLQRLDPTRRGGDEYGTQFRGSMVPTDLPRFELCEVRLTGKCDPDVLGPTAYYLEGVLPPDHLLPWPKLKRRDCKAYYTPETALEQVMIRRRSAMKAGLKRMPPIPDHFIDMLESGGLLRLVHERSVTLQKELGLAA